LLPQLLSVRRSHSRKAAGVVVAVVVVQAVAEAQVALLVVRSAALLVARLADHRM
jgi:hypothetical protein